MNLKKVAKNPTTKHKKHKQTPHHKQKRSKHTAIRTTHVSRGAPAAGGHPHDEWYNADENSEHADHFPHPPAGVRAYSFADKAYKVSFRFKKLGDKVIHTDIYEGETFHDALYRYSDNNPDGGFKYSTQCNLPSDMLQEEQLWDGPEGCGDCIGFIPPTHAKHLEPMWPEETQRMRQFLLTRLDAHKTDRDGGDPQRIRFLCVTNFTPALDGIEIYMPGNDYINNIVVPNHTAYFVHESKSI